MVNYALLIHLTKAICLSGILFSATAAAAENLYEIKLSLGSSWQESNEVQIPNDANGTRFSLNDIAGSGPWPGVRLEGIYNINEKHAVRVLLAPLSYSETGSVSEPIRFVGETYDANQPIEGAYTFNSWRAGYRYHMRARDNWDFWLGGTLKVRDAEIRLTQGGVTSSDDDVGLVPLLYLAGEYRFDSAWSVAGDIDALGGGPGRAIDLGLSVNYAVNPKWNLGFEYRALEGGADLDQLFNFAWFNSIFVTARYRP